MFLVELTKVAVPFECEKVKKSRSRSRGLGDRAITIRHGLHT